MKYIYKSLEFSQQNLGLLLLFIIINSIPLIVTTGESTNNQDFVINSILSILLYVIYFFLISGAYSLIWKRYKNENIYLSSLIHESKKYLYSVLGIEIVMGFIFIIILYILSTISYGLLSNNIFTDDEFVNFEFSIVIAISFFIESTIFCYAIPYIYAIKLSPKKALLSAPRIILNNKHESEPIILLLFIMFLISIFQLNNKGDLWLIATLGAVIISCIYFFVFLIACQILDELTKQENRLIKIISPFF